jgi:hypothetical protein
MPQDPEKILIYHITDVANLPGILVENGLLSDAVMAKRSTEIIGYDHIKKRRLLRPEHLKLAWQRLREQGWDAAL